MSKLLIAKILMKKKSLIKKNNLDIYKLIKKKKIDVHKDIIFEIYKKRITYF